MKIKEHPDFPKLRVRFLSDNNTPHQLGICEGRKQLHAEAGEIKLDQWLKDNGWVKDITMSICSAHTTKDPNCGACKTNLGFTIDAEKFCERAGYIKLSDVELDVGKMAMSLRHHVVWHGKKLHDLIGTKGMLDISKALSKAKDLLKIKEK